MYENFGKNGVFAFDLEEVRVELDSVLAERPADARILALALNGSIASEIPLTMKETWGPRWGDVSRSS